MSKTVIFYSGVENDFHYGIASKHADNVLMSYYYLQKKEADFLERKHRDKPAMNFMVDSGAYTLQAEKGATWGVAEWSAYVAKYAAWLRYNMAHIYSAVELDVANHVGLPIVEEWRRKYFAPLEREGMQIIYVWHLNENQDWDALCQRYRYVGIAQDALREGIAERMMLSARRYRTKVHGFALTSHNAVKRYTLATADSTTWKAGERYGAIHFWTGKRLQFIERKDRHKWKDLIVKLGYDFDGLMRDDPLAVSTLCMQEFRKMEDYYGVLRASRPDYWRARVPYPEIVDALSRERVQEWLDYIALDYTAVESYGGKAVLRTISLLQNGRLEEYMVNADENNTLLSQLLGIIVSIHDALSLSNVRDYYNGLFNIMEGVSPRGLEDMIPAADKMPMEREEEELADAESDVELEAILKGYDNEQEPTESREEGSL